MKNLEGLKNLVRVANAMEKRSQVSVKRRGMAFGYMRISKTEKEQKYSLSYQANLITEHYNKKFKDTHAWGGFYEDKVSGSVPLSARTAGKRILNQLLPGDVLICYNLDRMSRSFLDGAHIVSLFHHFNVALVSTDGQVDLTTIEGRSMAMMRIVFAEVERENISRRLKATAHYRKHVLRKGFVTHKVQPGWRRMRVQGELRHVPCKASRETAARIVLWRDQELLTWDEIGRRLRRRHIKHGSTNVWEHRTCHAWYDAAKAGFPNTYATQRENLPPLMVEVDDEATEAAPATT